MATSKTLPSFTAKLTKAKAAFTFDDVLILPAASAVMPRDADVSVHFLPGLPLHVPVLSSAMDTVTEAPMAIAIAQAGGLGVIHQNMTPERQAAEVAKVKMAGLPCAAAMGTGDDGLARADRLVNAGADLLVIDTAHGHAKSVQASVAAFKKRHPKVHLVAGNVATAAATRALIAAGADAVKVGIGPGSICTTRIVAGIGAPQLSAIAECADVARKHKVPIIADGGLRYSGDVVKALAAGATVVMFGSILAGTDEAPGDTFELDGKRFKSYRGMGSVAAMAQGSAARYLQGLAASTPKKLVPEGIEGRVACKGPVKDVLHQMVGGLKAGMGYVGAATLAELQSNAEFIRLTPAALRESHPHDVTITVKAPNY